MTNWVYLITKDGSHWLYTVGFYSPDGEWHSDSDHNTKEAAQKHCHYLNGGLQEFIENLINQKGKS